MAEDNSVDVLATSNEPTSAPEQAASTQEPSLDLTGAVAPEAVQAEAFAEPTESDAADFVRTNPEGAMHAYTILAGALMAAGVIPSPTDTQADAPEGTGEEIHHIREKTSEDNPVHALFDDLRNLLNRLPAELQNDAHALWSTIKQAL